MKNLEARQNCIKNYNLFRIKNETFIDSQYFGKDSDTQYTEQL